MNVLFNSLISRLLLFATTLMLGLQVSYSQSCEGTINAYKNRSFKSIGDNGAIFKIEIHNKSTSPQTYVITSKQFKGGCDNGRKAINKSNAQVKASVDLPNNSISLLPQEKKIFKVIVSSSIKNANDQWGCLELVASTQSCKDSFSTVLSAYIPDSLDSE